jgi:hypothetical protein
VGRRAARGARSLGLSSSGRAVSLLPVLTTTQKGAVAEAAIMKTAFEVGYDVYRPAIEGGRYASLYEFGAKLPQSRFGPIAQLGER